MEVQYGDIVYLMTPRPKEGGSRRFICKPTTTSNKTMFPVRDVNNNNTESVQPFGIRTVMAQERTGPLLAGQDFALEGIASDSVLGLTKETSNVIFESIAEDRLPSRQSLTVYKTQSGTKELYYGQPCKIYNPYSDQFLTVSDSGNLSGTRSEQLASVWYFQPDKPIWQCSDRELKLCRKTNGLQNLSLEIECIEMADSQVKCQTEDLSNVWTTEEQCRSLCRSSGWKCSMEPLWQCQLDPDTDQKFEECWYSCNIPR